MITSDVAFFPRGAPENQVSKTQFITQKNFKSKSHVQVIPRNTQKKKYLRNPRNTTIPVERNTFAIYSTMK